MHQGKFAELLYHPERLNYPLKRTRPKGDPDPGWMRISWDQTLSDIAEKLVAIRERHGSEAIALAKGTGSGTSIDDAVRWLARFLNVWGSPTWFSYNPRLQLAPRHRLQLYLWVQSPDAGSRTQQNFPALGSQSKLDIAHSCARHRYRSGAGNENRSR